MQYRRNPNRKFWKWGLFYYNPDDPDLLVQRLNGLGSDINFAHRKAYYLMAFMILFPIAVVVIPLYLLGYF